MNARLLERSNKSVKVNPAGQHVYRCAKEILALYARMELAVTDLMQQPRGELKIGASYTIGEYILPQVVARLIRLYPDIHPKITIANSTEIAKLVDAHTLDIGVVEGEIQHASLHVQPFAEDALAVTAAKNHPLSAGRPADSASLEQHTWIVRETGSGTREAQERLFQALDITPHQRMEFGSTQVIKESVEAGLGITLLSKWVIRKELKFGLLTTIDVPCDPIRRAFSWITRDALFHTKAMQVFTELLQEVQYEL